MKTTGWMAVLAAMVLAGGDVNAETLSAPVFVNTFQNYNRCWKTVFTNSVPLTWEWDWITNAAVSATLRIDGMNGSVTTNFVAPVSNWIWQTFPADLPAREDVFTLTLTFYRGDAAVVGVLTSQLAVVKGAFATATIDQVPNSTTWQTVGAQAVIPYDTRWGSETGAVSAAYGKLVITKVGGDTRSYTLPDANGYFGWVLDRSWGCYGTFDLALSFPNMETNLWYATLTRPTELGSIFSLR